VAKGRVAVVGAGLAGLSAGVDLTDAGYDVELFERGRLLGGRATSFEIGGHEVDNGQHVFLGCCDRFVAFVTRLGMASDLHLQARFDALVIARDGTRSRLRAARVPAPWHLMSAFAGYKHLRWGSKRRVALALARARDACASSGSFAHWLARTGQDEDALRAFWRPFFVPALNAPLERMSARDAGFVMLTAFLGDARAARFGFSTVPLARIARAAADRLNAVHLATPVTALARTADGSVAGIVLDGGDRRDFHGVVLALTPPALAHLLCDPAAYGVASLDGYESFPIVDVHLWHDRGSLGFDFAALLDSPVQWIFEKAPGYLCCSLSAATDDVRLSNDELVQRSWREVVRAIPLLDGAQLVLGAATRTPQATFLAKLDVARASAATTIPNLALAGSWTDTGWPDTMESAVISGKNAARLLVDALSSGNRAPLEGTSVA